MHAGGAAQPLITHGYLRQLEFVIPPLIEQRRIASILSAYDDLIEVNQRRIVVLESMVRQLFDARIARLQPVADAKNAANLSEGWKPVRLGHLATEVRDGVMPSSVRPDTPSVGLEHLPRRSTTLGVVGTVHGVTSLKFRFRRGDILFGKIRPYFHKVAIAPFDGICSSDTIVMRSKRPDVLGLVLGVVSSDAFVAHAVATSNGTKMPRASWSVLAEYPIPLPPPSILVRLNKFIIDATEAAAVHQATNIRLAAARDLVLPRLISGDLAVSAAEPDVEQAA
jgi:type I restriction enzyme S subunit